MATYYTFTGILNGPQTFKAGSRHTTADGYTAWSDVDALIVFKSGHGSDPVDGDQVTLCNSATGFYETREWRSNAWVAIGGIVNANAAYNFPRSAITTSRKGYKDWSDIAAVAAIRDAGKDFPIDGDAVTLYDDTWTSTRYYKDGKWIKDSLYFPGVLSAPSQPGIDDELKPNLPKRLRDW